MSKIIKIILIILVSLVVFAGIFLGYLFARKEYEIKRLSSYYQKLAQDCKQKESFSCCMASVNSMVGSNSKIKPEAGCPKGFRINRLKCLDSYAWCERMDKIENSENSNLPREIFKHWTSSYEEDIGDIKVYRLNSYNFPLSRKTRGGFEIKEDGKFILYDRNLGPDDRLIETKTNGHWETKTKNEIVVHLKYRIQPYTINIISYDNDVLKVKFSGGW